MCEHHCFLPSCASASWTVPSSPSYCSSVMVAREAILVGRWPSLWNEAMVRKARFGNWVFDFTMSASSYIPSNSWQAFCCLFLIIVITLFVICSQHAWQLMYDRPNSRSFSLEMISPRNVWQCAQYALWARLMSGGFIIHIWLYVLFCVLLDNVCV